MFKEVYLVQLSWSTKSERQTVRNIAGKADRSQTRRSLYTTVRTSLDLEESGSHQSFMQESNLIRFYS